MSRSCGRLLVLVVCSLSASGCGESTDVSPATSPSPLIPCLSAPFSRVFTPAGGRYLNDHTIVQAPDGLWHLVGITGTSSALLPPTDQERTFLHATASSLHGPFTEHPDVMTADPALNEAVLWAPHIVTASPGDWVMFYWAGELEPEQPQRGLRRADSRDLWSWRRWEQTPDAGERPPGGRDPCLLRDGDRWLLYSVGRDAAFHGQILVTENADLNDPHGWSEPRAVITDPLLGDRLPDGNLESPHVVKHRGYYYLFLTRTGQDYRADYFRTDVFRSTDPMQFQPPDAAEWQPITTIEAHAAEVVVDGDQFYLSSAGWTAYVTEQRRGLAIAPFVWVTSCATQLGWQ